MLLQKRKPLVLSGVRQCGKTYILQQFGHKNFPKVHYINFEQEPSKLKEIFTQDLVPNRIINELSFHLQKNIDIKKDLVIFDEIQDCPLAITSLKYFCEQMPELALCCAGSLLGLQLNSTSFPVGKVDILYMYPMSFNEFIDALGEDKSSDYLNNHNYKPLPEVVHSHLFELLKWYFIVGGLPEIINIFKKQRHNLFAAFNEVRLQQQLLIKEYYADIAKHSGKINAMHITRVWQNVPAQLAANYSNSTSRFKFKGIIPGLERYSKLTDTIDWLIAAHHVIKVPIINTGELPPSAYIKENMFKLYMFDVGILGAMSNLPPQIILDYNYNTYKGYFAENFVIQQLALQGIDNMYSWQQQRLEVEFLQIQNDGLIPIEVKSANVVKAQSLNKYCEKYSPPRSIIYSARNISVNNKNHLYCLPLYLAGIN